MTRDKNVRVNKKDLAMLKSAKDELDVDAPLGYVARRGAAKLIEEGDEGIGY